MLKVQHPVDYLKKESTHSEVEQVGWQRRPVLKRSKRVGDLPRKSTDFVSATLGGTYNYWLMQADIAGIARTTYGWHGEDNNVIFDVIGSIEHLGVQLEQHKDKLRQPDRRSLTFVYNLGGNHWTTLVIAYQGNQFSAYYIDSLGNGIPNDVRSVLEEKVAGITIYPFNIRQQTDGHNCGIFALENAKIINDALQTGQQGQIEQGLSNYKPTEEQLINRRIEFAENLGERGADILGSGSVDAINGKNTDEVPQRSELLERLIEEMTAGTPAQQKGRLDQSFEARFRSFIHKIPSVLHSVMKKGFFPHFFLGGFSTLLDTQIAKKLNIKKIYFRFDTAETLKVVVIKNGQIRSAEDITNNINLFSISEGKHGHQFTSGELEKILQENIESGGLTEQDIKKEVKDRVKSRLVRISKGTSKGRGGISVSMEDKEILDSDTSHKFREIEKGLWNNPEGDIAKLADFNKAKIRGFYKETFEKIYDVHSKYEGSFKYGKGAREAAHHGFITGVFMNFRYGYHIRIGLEKLEGGGYADIKLQVRGVDNSPDSFSTYIEVKASPPKELKKLKRGEVIEDSSTSPEAALKQAMGYAQGSRENSLAFGVNLDYPSPISDVVVVNQEEKVVPLLEGVLEFADGWNKGELDEKVLKTRIQNNIKDIHHKFPGTSEKRNHHYFSRFLLGQSILLNKVEALETEFEKHIFIYGENIPTEIRLKGKDRDVPQREAAKEADEKLAELAVFDESHAVVTMVLIPKDTEEPIYVMHIVEADREVVLNKKLPLDELGGEIKDRGIVELTLNFNVVLKGRGAKSQFEKRFSMDANKYYSLEHYNGVGNGVFQGAFKEMPYPDGLQEAFGEAIDSKLIDAQDQPALVDKYDELFKKIGEGIFPCKFLIESESHTQAVIDGLFQYYRDLRLSEVSVSTEFQLGGGKRIDMLICVGRVCVGIEVKGPRGNVGVGALGREAGIQISGYAEGDYSITGAKKVFLRGYIFDTRATDASSIVVRVNDEVGSPLEEIVEVIYSSQEYEVSVDEQPTRKRQKTSEFQVGCSSSKRRKTRSTGESCIDSRDEESAEEKKGKEELIKELFDSDKIRERIKNVEFYDQLFKVSEQISKGEIIDPSIEEALIAKIKNIDLDSIDPEIKDIVEKIKEKTSEEKEEIRNILTRPGVTEKMGKAAEGAGHALAVYFVAQHMVNGDIEGLGYDALNLLVLPKVGEAVSGKLLELGAKYNSQALKGFAPIAGSVIGNFLAFVGLVESIKDLLNAEDPIDRKFAELGIAINSLYIAVDIPSVIIEMMSSAGVLVGAAGEFAGPVGTAATVAIVIVSQLVEAELKVEKVEESIKLTDEERTQLYWRFVFGMKAPENIERDMEAKKIYENYMSEIIDKSKDNFNTIVMTLPYISLTREKHGTGEGGGRCPINTKIFDIKYDFGFSANVTYPSHIYTNSRVIPESIESYDVVCGPQDSDVKVQIDDHACTDCVVNGIGSGCDDLYSHSNVLLNRTLEKLSLHQYPLSCNNTVVYNEKGSNKYRSMYYMRSQSAEIQIHENSNITVAFYGKNISIRSTEQKEDVSHSTENGCHFPQPLKNREDSIFSGNIFSVENEYDSPQLRGNMYYFSQPLENCKVQKPGDNFFYIEGNDFSCELGKDGQKNIVVVKGNFTDSNNENIQAIIGSNATNFIEVFHAGYVDGKGGNDTITAQNSTTIMGNFGDNIYGKGLVLLPMAFSDINKMILDDDKNTIYSEDGNLIIHGKEMLMRTRDNFFVTPTKTDRKTKMVTNLHIVNYNETEALEEHTDCASGDDSIPQLMLFAIEENTFKEGSEKVGFHFMHKLFSGVLHRNGSGSFFVDSTPFITMLALQGEFPSNPNFETTRQIFSKKLDVVIGDSGHHIFYADKQSHFFYWEGAENVPNLYLFDDKNVTVIINKANGLLDFSMIKSEEEYKAEVEEDAVFIVKGNVSVVLPMNYKNITVTFDQKEYYKLQGGKLERDYCSHSLKIGGRLSVNGADLLNYNCFTFDTGKVFFFRLDNDLQLVSDKGALSILGYYNPDNDVSHALEGRQPTAELDLSIKLSNGIIEPEEFRERADNPSSSRYYLIKPGFNNFPELVSNIYHNQPENQHKIGLVDLKGWSILSYSLVLAGSSLELFYTSNDGNLYSIIKVKNWAIFPPVRMMMFAFNDTVVSNGKCIVSNCDPEDIVKEFKKEKVRLVNEKGKDINVPPDYVEKSGSVNVDNSLPWLISLQEERNEESKQRHRRHHIRHEDHHRGHRNHRSPIQEVTSSAVRPSSWINAFANTVVGAAKGVYQFISSPFKPAIDMEHSQPSKAMTTQSIDTNGTLLLLDVFIRKVTGQKYISNNIRSISEQEAQIHALPIAKEFEQALEGAAIESGIPVTNLKFNPVEVFLKVAGQIRSGKFSEISKTLYSSAKEACPEFEQTGEFLVHVKSHLEEFLAKKENVFLQQKQTADQPTSSVSRKVVTMESSKKPDTFLSDTSVAKGIKHVLGL